MNLNVPPGGVHAKTLRAGIWRFCGSPSHWTTPTVGGAAIANDDRQALPPAQRQTGLFNLLRRTSAESMRRYLGAQ